ncbi:MULTISPECIES: hypothetical protein [Streptomyces]|uniref:Hydrogenase expression protein HypF n=1 Tax=Streptomyces prasinus TaxID=67345 RepID=A0ABX6B039_9ACTN|nr:hypothetical protein [Streptomyces prasinus]QEV08388.1 hypothetical protein CP972_24640 [Streptomyces prasinus]
MSADKTRDRSVPAALAPARSGPRHAAPRKPLSTRFHMPAGKAIALAAMPTAVLMGMGFTPTLAQADEQPKSRSLTADEYKDCLAALEDAEDGATASDGPSAPASDTASPGEEAPAAEASPSASAGDAAEAPDTGTGTGSSSSPDAGSDDKDGRNGAAPAGSGASGKQTGERTSEPEPTPSETERNALEEFGDAVKDFFTPKDRKTGEATASPAPSSPASAVGGAAGDGADPAEGTAGKPAGATGKPADAEDEAAGKAEEAAGPAAEADDGVTATPEATASPSPSPSASATTGVDDCPVATDAEGGVDNKILLPEDPWFLNASSLLLTGADYQGVVEVRTASGRTKKVLKYVVSQGTDIGDLHQTVEDRTSGRTHHVRAAKGSTSTIRDGETVMYTESISGKLLGLIQVTFDPENPPPLNIPLIYFTDVTVQQAGQFGGTLHIPGLRQYVD